MASVKHFGRTTAQPLQKLAAKIFWNPMLKLNLVCKDEGAYPVEDVIAFLRTQVAMDPGDLLLQHMKQEEIEAELKCVVTHADIFGLLGKLMT